MRKTGKKITAFSVSFLLMLNLTATVIPVSAEAESKVYTHDGYTVEYTVKNEWTGNQNIEVTITNTGDDVLSGWAMGYNAFGEIGGLWNAKIYGHQGTEYILSSAGYNDELAPGQSTNFGYTLTGDSFKIPQDIVNCAKRVDIAEGYNVYYNITADFVDTYQAEMIIENTSDTDITAWQLSFDGNVSIDNLWNGKLLENNNGSFKVKNAENNSVIAAGSSVSFNFGGTKNTEIEPNPGYSEPAETTPPVTVVTDEFSETETSAESAETDASNPETDPTETETSTESDVVSVSEVVFSNYKLTGVVIPMEFDFEIDPEMDSDEDGLPDYIEKEIGSDRYNPDTDDDGLPDGYEYFTLGTDPKKADSDDNGISDADEDFDEDGLTNLEEYNLGTAPFSKDSDYDGLSDYDEVKIYNTDPLKYDTDGDKVSDGDEINLGLDPNNPSTHGYPDNEYTTTQTVGEDSSALDYINNIEDNPYSVTVEITAAGVAGNNLTAGESGYSYSILQNDAVLGVVPEFDYSDGLSVTDVVIKFKIDDSAVDNKLGVYADEPEFNGINRLQVFKYFEDNNILLPIETFYDEETKTVYTHVDELGTYCLMDMEMWINYLENLEPGNYYEEDDEVKSANIAFCLDTRYIADESSFDSVKSDMKAIAEDAFDRYADVKVYVYYQELGMSLRAKDNLLMDKDGNNYFTSYEEAEAAIDGMAMPKKSVAYDLVHASNYMIDVCDRSCKAEDLDKNIIAMYHITNDDNIVGSVDDAKQLIRTVEDSAYTDKNDEQAYRINVSVICPNGEAKEGSYAEKLVNASMGIFYSGNTQEVQVQTQVMTLNIAANNNEQEMTTADTIKENIINICGYGDGLKFKVILSTGLIGDIKLKERLIEGSSTDFDEDGLSDWDEVNIELVAKYAAENDEKLEKKDGKYIIKTNNLPTIAQILSSGNWKFYTENVPDKLMRFATAAGIMNKDDWRILPINSNPCDADSDNDGIIDKYDKNALKYCENNDDIKNNYNSAFVTFELDKSDKIKLSGLSIPLKALPDLTSTTLELIDNKNDTDYEVEYVTITSNDSWVRIYYNGVYGYVHNSFVKVDDSNETLLKIMFSDVSCIDGITYYAYWHNEPENVVIKSKNRTIDTSIPPLKRQDDYSNEDKSKLTISQSELGYLYVMTKEIFDAYNLNQKHELGFLWLLSASMHETSLGMSTGKDIDTWKSINTGHEATGYFQCTDAPEDQIANEILTVELINSGDISNVYLGKRGLIMRWSNLAIRLDCKHESVVGESEYTLNNGVGPQVERSVIICSRNYYYGNISTAGNILRGYLDKKANRNLSNNEYDFPYNFFKTFASKEKEDEIGYRPEEFISILNTLKEKYLEQLL